MHLPYGTQCDRESKLGRLCERECRLRLSVRVTVGWGTWPIGLRVRGRVGLRAPGELSDRESRLGYIAQGHLSVRLSIG